MELSVRNPYIAAVPQDILDHPDTTIESLKDYCRERGIAFGERPSVSVLRAKLMASNADVQTVWSLRMTALAATAMAERPAGEDHLDQFQAAIYHPPTVPPDEPPPVVVAGSAPAARPLPSSGGMDPSLDRETPARPQFKTPFRRPPVRAISLMGLTPSSPPRTSSPTLSPNPAVDDAVAGEDDEVTTRESDRLYLKYCMVKRAEEARDLHKSQQKDHTELKGLLVSLGQSMANVSGVVQAHASSATVTAQRHTDGLVAISRDQRELRAALEHPATSLAAMRAPKRQKTSVAAASQLRPQGARDNGATSATVGPVEPSKKWTVRRDMIFSPIMEAEMMEARLPSTPLAKQLERIVRLAHVSPGKPGIFGSYVVFGLYESAGVEAAAEAEPGTLVSQVNKEKQRRMKNIIMNKADTYVRLLFWLKMAVPEIMGTAAPDATAEKMEEFTMTTERCDKLQAALKVEALKAKYELTHPILVPAKARMSTLRDLLHALVVDHGYASNVEEMLKTSPFRERLAEASKRIRPRYEDNS